MLIQVSNYYLKHQTRLPISANDKRSSLFGVASLLKLNVLLLQNGIKNETMCIQPEANLVNNFTLVILDVW